MFLASTGKWDPYQAMTEKLYNVVLPKHNTFDKMIEYCNLKYKFR